MEKPSPNRRQNKAKSSPKSVHTEENKIINTLIYKTLENKESIGKNPSLSANELQCVENQRLSFFVAKLSPFFGKLLSDKFITFLETQEKFTEPFINFATRRLKDKKGNPLPIAKQPKNPKGKWYLDYQFYSEVTLRLERVRDYGKSIGGFKKGDLKERVRRITNYRDSLHELLKSGQYNPFAEDAKYIKKLIEKKSKAAFVEKANPQTEGYKIKDIQKLSVIEALRWGLEIKKSEGLAINSVDTYSNCLAHWESGLKKHGYESVNILQFTPAQFIESMDMAKVIHSMTNKRYNTIRANMKTMFGYLVDKLIIESVPIVKAKKLKEEQSEGVKSPTLYQLQKIIVPFLQETHKGLLDALIIFWNLGLRNHDLTQLRVKNIDLPNGRYKIIPEIEMTERGALRNKKNNNIKEGPIPEEAYYVLKKLLDAAPDSQPDWYVIGTKYKTGPVGMKPDTITRHWKELVKDDDKFNEKGVLLKRGLNMDVSFYGCRHTSGQEVIETVADLETAQLHLGHENKDITMAYVGGKINNLKEAELLKKLPKLII